MTNSPNITLPTIRPPIIGSHDDIYNKLIQTLPGWWGSDHLNLDTILEAFINTATFHYRQIIYASLQMRLQSATDINLDQISQDYLGDTLPRRSGENDRTYRKRIEATLLQEKATRPGLDNTLFILTGYHPLLFEPWYPLDCGGYNVYQKMGYSTAGKYGSGSYAYQGFADVFVSVYNGMGKYSGYNSYYGGYNAAGTPATLWYGGESLLDIIVTDQDILQTINLTKVYGTIVWVRILRV